MLVEISMRPFRNKKCGDQNKTERKLKKFFLFQEYTACFWYGAKHKITDIYQNVWRHERICTCVATVQKTYVSSVQTGVYDFNIGSLIVFLQIPKCNMKTFFDVQTPSDRSMQSKPPFNCLLISSDDLYGLTVKLKHVVIFTGTFMLSY